VQHDDLHDVNQLVRRRTADLARRVGQLSRTLTFHAVARAYPGEFDAYPGRSAAWINKCAGGDYYSPHYLAAADNPPCPRNAARAASQDQLPHDDPTEESETDDLPAEACDGVNDDGDDEVDEGCPDRDQDGIINALDNCPGTPNPGQVDSDHNYTGDACEPRVPPTAACIGDCDKSGVVTIDELVRGVNIVLGAQPLDACGSFDSDGNGLVTVHELTQAVNAALSGCD